tara:strand:- start:1074 stop:1295 length:222 start_codon:yes stop_codon:yes gene_type:complete
MEPLTPFTKLYESEELNDVVDYVDDNKDNDTTLFVSLKDGTILFDTSMLIYESPDGKVLYRRIPLSNKRTKIN